MYNRQPRARLRIHSGKSWSQPDQSGPVLSSCSCSVCCTCCTLCLSDQLLQHWLQARHRHQTMMSDEACPAAHFGSRGDSCFGLSRNQVARNSPATSSLEVRGGELIIRIEPDAAAPERLPKPRLLASRVFPLAMKRDLIQMVADSVFIS